MYVHRKSRIDDSLEEGSYLGRLKYNPLTRRVRELVHTERVWKSLRKMIEERGFTLKWRYSLKSGKTCGAEGRWNNGYISVGDCSDQLCTI